MKVTSSSGIFKHIYPNGSYLFYLKSENYKVFKFHMNYSFYFEIGV